MGIKDIVLPSANLATANSESGVSPASTLAGVPVPQKLEDIILSGTKTPLTENPMSGSIFKILGENGFKQKIEEGYKKGHAYTILHSAPSKDFTLVDTWTEMRTDETGASVATPRKNYQFFSITSPITPSHEPKVMELTAAEPAASEPLPSAPVAPKEPVSNISEIPVKELQQTITALATPETPKDGPILEDRARAISEKIKKGGAGMTPEDWQFRNENWPLIEKYLAPKAATTSPAPVTATPTTPTTAQSVSTPSSTPPLEPAPETPPVEAVVKQDDQPQPVAQHYDSRAWLMKKLGRTETTTQNTQPAPGTTSPSAAASSHQVLSSYELLKKRFAQSGTQEANVAAQSQTSESQVSEKTPLQREQEFINSIFGSEMSIWESAKTIPARAFIYPTEYSWGTDTSGNPIERSLEDYPSPARKLREKIAQAVEDMGASGTSIESTPIGEVLSHIFNKGIL